MRSVFFAVALALLCMGDARSLYGQGVGPVVWVAEGASAADFNDDGVISFADFVLFARSYNTISSDTSFNLRMDLNRDGEINFTDFVSFGSVYGSQAAVAPPATGYAVYVVDAANGSVIVLDSNSHLISNYIQLRGPTGIRISKDQRSIYVSEGFALFALDEEHRVRFSVPTESQGRVVLSLDEQVAYVTQELRDQLLVIDLVTQAVVDTIQVGDQPVDAEITPDGKKLYVVNARSRDVSVIDLESRTQTGTIVIGAIPSEIGITADGRRAYVANLDRGVISVLDLVADRVVGAIQLQGERSRGVTFSADGKTLYVTSSGQLLAVDVQRNLIVRSLQLGNESASIGISPDGKRAYVGTFVAQGGGAGLTVIDLEEWSVLGRLLGFDFIAEIVFRTLGAAQ
ncbi:MAG: dockerin type I domain-containing protein [bacterium]|nr:dockerin type I domain-containing protein [bacterium]